jgi:hypothetical protein
MAAIVCHPGESLREHDEVVARIGEELRKLTDDQQFRILFPIATKSQAHGDFPVLDAALLLHQLSPHCPITCEEAIRALLPEWDVSIEQVPFYLAARFGPARVLQAIASLGPAVTDKSQRVNLDTVSYWVHVYEGTWPSKS